MIDLVTGIARAETLRAIAIIVHQEGPAYRPLGAMMAIYEDGQFDGHISSGCIEADLLVHSMDLKGVKILRYGRGSPFVDLRLPCGGAMDVLLIPSPPTDVFRKLSNTLAARKPTAVRFCIKTGCIEESHARSTNAEGGFFHLYLEPELQFFVFGNGMEARVFAELTDGAGYPVELFSTNPDMLSDCRILETCQHLMKIPKIENINAVDEWTSIILFFHEHELEEQILLDALKTKAFYIGAQGSERTHQSRLQNLMLIKAENTDRIRGPIGLIPQTRDPQTLAISVLAEIHAVAQERAR